MGKDVDFGSYRKGDKFQDGSFLKRKYFFDNEKEYIIYLNSEDEVKYKTNLSSNSIHKLENLPLIIGEINNLYPFLKKDLNLKLAYIYKLGLLNEIEVGNKEVKELLKIIEARKKIIKQFSYLLIPLIGLLFSFLFEIKFKRELVFTFASIGCFISISTNINDIEFNTEEMVKSYFIFALFRYIHSLFSAILLVFLYKSNIINIKLNGTSEEKFIILLATLGGFSAKLIPNIFEKYGEKYID
ncbi:MULTISPECIES: hypothetical protein [Fusobacterium]|nr:MULTISPECIES: hypothetical protein [Fusobacterium]